MWGSATATIDESIAPMRVPNVIDTVTSHLLGLGRAARRADAIGEARAEGVEAAVVIFALRSIPMLARG